MNAILLFTASYLASVTTHIHNWVLFLLWLHPFILSGVISPLISSSILGTYWHGQFIIQCSIFCLFTLFMGFSRQEYWSGLPSPSPVDHILSDLSTMTCPSWVAPQGMLSFIELDKAVVLVWLEEYWSGLPFPPPGNLPDPGTEPASPALAGGFFTTRATWEALTIITYTISKQGVKLALLFISWKITLRSC